MESFSGRLRNECLYDHWFRSIHEAQDLIGLWREDYNNIRPHSSLNYQTPTEFFQNFGSTPMGVDITKEVVNI